MPTTRLGRIYEKTIIMSLGHKINTDNCVLPNGTKKNGKVKGSAVPDLIGFTSYIHKDKNEENASFLYFPDALIMDAKLKKDIQFEDKYNSTQAKIYIDYLSNLSGGYKNGRYDSDLKAKDYRMAHLIYVTPSNGVIDQELVDYATEKGVLVIQRFTQIAVGDKNRMRISPKNKILNPEILSPDALDLMNNAGSGRFNDSGSVNFDWEQK